MSEVAEQKKGIRYQIEQAIWAVAQDNKMFVDEKKTSINFKSTDTIAIKFELKMNDPQQKLYKAGGKKQ
jgi:hypothetical protein